MWASALLITSLGAVAQDGLMPIRDDAKVRELPVAQWPDDPSQQPKPTPTPPAVEEDRSLKEAQELRAKIARKEAEVATQSAEVFASASKPPPSKIDAKAGINQIIPIGIGALNRIRTNFAHPELKTVSDAMIEAEGSVIYVASNTIDPINLFVHEAGRPDQALSLTLMPKRLPPIDISVSLEGYDAVEMPVAADVAKDWELSQPYVETITELMGALARGKVPAGYGLQTLKHPMHPLMPHCSFDGAIATPSQVLTGSVFVVLVARVSNRGSRYLTLDESRCMTDGVRAVAAWPKRELGPGQETEVYIVVERPPAAIAGRERPSALSVKP